MAKADLYWATPRFIC